MWTILSAIAIVSLIGFFSRGPNAIWGGATVGLIVGFILALFGDKFEWFTVWKGFVVGILLGLLAGIPIFLRNASETNKKY